jgi:dephospho-CoA kinase
MNTKNIAFTGWAGAGKTEAARYLVNTYGYNVISFADGIKWIDKEVFGSTSKDRSRLQAIGEKMREIDSECWVTHNYN